jgi:isoleucyl-tRNA synthetase
MSMVINGEPCTNAFMTHGFTVDEKGHKMSKSLGNVVSPREIIDMLGTDGLRLWVASIGHESDAVVSKVLLENIREVNRKVRNTCRFLLSNLYDFDIEKDSVSIDQLLPIDYYAFTKLSEINGSLVHAYGEGDFTKVFHELAEYCTVELSSYYLDIVKDRLYCEGARSIERRSAQTALWFILDTLTRLIAPVMSFTAERISDHYQKDKKKSIHLQPFVDPEKLHKLVYASMEKLLPGLIVPKVGTLVRLVHEIEDSQKELAFATQWETLKDIRNVLLKAIEEQREKGIIKHPLEASLTVYLDRSKPEFEPLDDFFTFIQSRGSSLEQFFKDYLIVSVFNLVDSKENLNETSDKGILVRVDVAEGDKCPRCWHYDKTRNIDKLCHRCEEVLASS